MPLTLPRRWPSLVGAGLLAVALASVAAPRAACASAAAPADATTVRDPDRNALQRIVMLLQYIGEEYPESLEEAFESEIVEQQKLSAEMLAAARALGGVAAPFMERVTSLEERIKRRADPMGVAHDCEVLAGEIIAAAGIATHPDRAPSLSRGRAVFEATCAGCHLRERFLAMPGNETMQPQPTSFFDADIMNHLSPFKAFGILSFGVPGTAMAPFEHVLGADDRWAVAFYLFTLRQPACTGELPALSIARVATATDQELVLSQGENGLACIRRGSVAEGAHKTRRLLGRRPVRAAAALMLAMLASASLVLVLWKRSASV